MSQGFAAGLDRAKLAKVLAMLSSTHDGEALAAARRAVAIAKTAGVTWQDILLTPAQDPNAAFLAARRAYATGFAEGRLAGLAQARAEARAQTVAEDDLAAWTLLASIRKSQGLAMPSGVPDPAESPWSRCHRTYVATLLEANAHRETAPPPGSAAGTAAKPRGRKSAGRR